MKKNLIFSLLAIAALWLAWVVAYYTVRNDYVLPSVKDTFLALGGLLRSGAFWRAFAGTLLRALWAFLLSLLLGCALAACSAVSEGVRAFLAPVVSVLRTVPTMAIVLVLLLWTNPSVAPVVIAVLVLMPAFYATTLSAVTQARERYGDLARVYGVGRGRQIAKLYLPLAAPAVLSQAGSIFSMGLKVTVSGEVLSATYRSLGGMMAEMQAFLRIPHLLALTLVTLVLGFALEGICYGVYKLIVRWRA